MPLFDFHCKACRRTFELLISASSTPTCPHCGSTALQKKLGLTAPQGRSKAVIASARRQAAREGHFSHYKPAERPKQPR